MFNQPTGLPFQTYSAIPLEGIDQDLVESRGGDVENLHDSRKRSNANIFERIQQLHQAAQQVLDCQDADEDHALNHRKSGVNELTNVVQTQMSDSLINDKVFMDDLEQR